MTGVLSFTFTAAMFAGTLNWPTEARFSVYFGESGILQIQISYVEHRGPSDGV